MAIIHSNMFSCENNRRIPGAGVRSHALAKASAIALALCLSLAATGCVESTLPKHVTALANATAPVVDQAAAAYHTAQAIHAQSVDYDAAAAFDKTNAFAAGTIQDWPSDKDIQIRLAVLKAFQLYVKDLGAITGSTDSPALDAASKSMGESLTSLGNGLAPTVEGALGVTPAPASTTTTTTTTTTGSTTTTTTSSSSTPAPLITSGVQAGISTALNALGQFLIERTANNELPPLIEKMDPHVEALCELLAKDIGIIQEQEKLDSDEIIDQQTAFAQNPKLDPEERRVEFLKLPEMVRQQRANDQSLTELKASILNLELTHHALAAAAQGNNPETFTQKLGDLAAAGESLGKFYSSLSPAQ
jgi:hypothetical protein